MRRIVIALLIAAGLISGCGKAEKKLEVIDSTMATDKTADDFQIITYGYDFYIVVDQVTHVMYAVSDGSYNHGTLTLLVDANGKPRLWEGE